MVFGLWNFRLDEYCVVSTYYPQLLLYHIKQKLSNKKDVYITHPLRELIVASSGGPSGI